jgi:hypothetical protein
MRRQVHDGLVKLHRSVVVEVPGFCKRAVRHPRIDAQRFWGAERAEGRGAAEDCSRVVMLDAGAAFVPVDRKRFRTLASAFRRSSRLEVQIPRLRATCSARDDSTLAHPRRVATHRCLLRFRSFRPLRLPRAVERDRLANERLERCRVHLFAFADVDRATDIAVEARVEESLRILE